MAPIGTIYGWNKPTYNDFRVYKALIAAAYKGLDLKLQKIERGVDNKSDDFLSKFPLGKTPAFELFEGGNVKLVESNAIAFYGIFLSISNFR